MADIWCTAIQILNMIKPLLVHEWMMDGISFCKLVKTFCMSNLIPTPKKQMSNHIRHRYTLQSFSSVQTKSIVYGDISLGNYLKESIGLDTSRKRHKNRDIRIIKQQKAAAERPIKSSKCKRNRQSKRQYFY